MELNFSEIEMTKLGCGHGDLMLHYGDGVPLQHVDLYEDLVPFGSDSNLTSCIELNPIR